MKGCLRGSYHATCRYKAWNGDKSRLLCIRQSGRCEYRSDFIRFEDIEDDTIMYSGNIENTYEFKTKSEWIDQYGHSDFQSESDDSWHTATIKIATINLSDLLDTTEESEEMYDGWCGDVCLCLDDPIVVAGIARLNEMLGNYPTYVEDLEVTFPVKEGGTDDGEL